MKALHTPDGGHCNACAKVGLACTFANPECLCRRPSSNKYVFLTSF
ncbi:hypothetical protein VP01_3445g3 [Puccinia sorghi]|uniref:Uncharacterized protein n=1 Tax=Puccinia sorghi TaxID=27349 RepID=A0A0L6UW95_9BASI|nr:hypothetical protein VP01_3445g3 [Puccinia sorghi]